MFLVVVVLLTQCISQAQKTCRFLHDYLEQCSFEFHIDLCLDNPINLSLL